MSTTTAVWPARSPAVGDRVQRSRPVSPEDIERFTEISGDRNPLHDDQEAARRSRFGGIVVHVQGGVTTAILNAVVAEELPGPGSVFLNVSWNVRAPARPGDTITGQLAGGPLAHGAPRVTDFFTRHRIVERGRHRLRGRASWGHRPIVSVAVSTDGGSTWTATQLEAPLGRGGVDRLARGVGGGQPRIAGAVLPRDRRRRPHPAAPPRRGTLAATP